MPSLFALLVGIDEYAPTSHVPTLQGCVNDANAAREFLEERFAPLPANLLCLLNEQATWTNVINAFRDHLGKAAAGDLAFFFYAGHGSEQAAAGIDLENEPDGMDQTVVLYDSRAVGGRDLVDKELGVLIEEITGRGVHMTVMLDCCHSGAGTRDLDGLVARQAPARATTPALSSILSGASSVPSAGTPRGSHIALEACQSVEVANEYKVGDAHRGAFTYFLLQELQACSQLPSYFDLMQRVRPRVQAQVSQTPQLETVNGDDDLHNVFLGWTRAATAQGRVARYTVEKTWQIDAGSLLGVSVGDTYAVYASGAMALALSSATVASVDSAMSALTMADDSRLDRSLLYTAIATGRWAKVNVALSGDANALALLRAALGSSLYVQEGSGARFTVTCSGGTMQIGAPLMHGLIPPALDANAGNAALIVAGLEHMAQWIARLEMQGVVSSLSADAVQLSVIQCDKPGQPTIDYADFGVLELAYTRDASGVLQPPNIEVRVSNHSGQVLFLALLAFSSDWSIAADLFPAGEQRLESGRSVFAYAAADQSSGLPIPVTIAPPATESHDDLVLLASTEPIHGRDFTLGPLADAMQATRTIGSPAPVAIPHGQLIRRVHLHTVLASA